MKTALRLSFRVLLFLIFSSVFFFKPRIVLAEWVKYPGNPIFSPTLPWEGQASKGSNLLITGTKYRMWYVGNSGSGWRIGHASSPNGADSWLKTSNSIISVGSSDGWERETDEPFVLPGTSSNYQMWYLSIGSNWAGGPNRFRLRHTTSNDGISWTDNTTNSNYVFIGSTGSWDSGGPARGKTILSIGGVYHMWYAGTNEGWSWRIGYATSPDGINWTKQNGGNPVVAPTTSCDLNNVSYPSVVFSDGLYEMWYAAGSGDQPTQFCYATSSNGFTWNKPADQTPVLTRGSIGSWDSYIIASPFVLKQGDYYRMYYSGTNGSQWRIGLAEMGTPPTSTPTPTPTLVSLHPLVFLPGLGASWNHEAMILRIDKPQPDWYMTPGIKVYDGLIQTFKNAGYQTEDAGKNLFIFNYNWTKLVASIAEDLRNYIQNVVNPPPGIEIDLVGHSLGGLVARTYVQNNPVNQVDQLITLGSPQHGVVQIYYPWEGGDLSYFPAWERIGLGLLLYIRNPGFSSPKEAIHSVAPVIKDLLPDFNYLKQDGVEKPLDSMIEKNNWLMGLNSSLPNHLLSALNAFVGKIADSTLRWIKVQPRTWLDKTLGLWVDGKPTGEKEFAEGDRTILSESGQLGEAILTELSGLNHSELVQSIAGQQKLMEVLGLIPSEISNLSVGLSYEPALVFLLASPATMTILNPNGDPTGIGDGKLVTVNNATAGEYQIILSGTDNGEYQLHLGQITGNDDKWTIISGSINTGQTIVYRLNFQPQNPLENPFIDPTGANYLQSGRSKLFELKDYINQNVTSNVVKRTLLSYLNFIIHLIDKNKIEEAIFSLYQMRFQICNWQLSGKIDENMARILKNKIQDAFTDLEQSYIIIETNKGGVYSGLLLSREISAAEKIFQKMESKLKSLESQDKAKPDHGALYLLASDKLNQAKSSTSYKAHIKALGAKYLSQEGLAF